MNWLISYNHSGNGWVRYCIEYLTGLPTHGHQPFSMSQRDNNFLNLDLDKPPVVIKRHEIQLHELNQNVDRVLLLVRNPYDAIKDYKDIKKEFQKYYNLIKVYEQFTGNKIYLNFNQLFNIKTIEKIIKFFNLKVNPNKLELLRLTFNYHKQRSKSIHQNKMNLKGSDLKEIDIRLLNEIKYYWKDEKITTT